MKYKAVLFSEDGADYTTDCWQSPTIEEVWNQLNDMGSRWYFYPVACVIRDYGTPTYDFESNRRHIVDAPVEYKPLIGLTIKQAQETLHRWSLKPEEANS